MNRTMKRCSICGSTKPLSSLYRAPGGGWHDECRNCQTVDQREKRQREERRRPAKTQTADVEAWT
jgi:hypothetical protein